MSDLHQIFKHVTYDRGSVLLWRRCDMLCTSGCMDDVISQGCSTSPICHFWDTACSEVQTTNYCLIALLTRMLSAFAIKHRHVYSVYSFSAKQHACRSSTSRPICSCAARCTCDLLMPNAHRETGRNSTILSRSGGVNWTLLSFRQMSRQRCCLAWWHRRSCFHELTVVQLNGSAACLEVTRITKYCHCKAVSCQTLGMP